MSKFKDYDEYVFSKSCLQCNGAAHKPEEYGRECLYHYASVEERAIYYGPLCKRCCGAKKKLAHIKEWDDPDDDYEEGRTDNDLPTEYTTAYTKFREHFLMEYTPYTVFQSYAMLSEARPDQPNVRIVCGSLIPVINRNVREDIDLSGYYDSVSSAYVKVFHNDTLYPYCIADASETHATLTCQFMYLIKHVGDTYKETTCKLVAYNKQIKEDTKLVEELELALSSNHMATGEQLKETDDIADNTLWVMNIERLRIMKELHKAKLRLQSNKDEYAAVQSSRDLFYECKSCTLSLKPIQLPFGKFELDREMYTLVKWHKVQKPHVCFD